MYAVIKTGGKQYKVAAGNLITVDKLAGNAGDAVSFDQVLLVGGDTDPQIGSPVVAGAAVTGEIVGQQRGETIRVFKKRRRKNSKRTRGHRQQETLVRITDVALGGGKKRAAPKAEAKPASEEKTAPVEAKPGAVEKEPSAEAHSGARGGVEKPKPARKPRAKPAKSDE